LNVFVLLSVKHYIYTLCLNFKTNNSGKILFFKFNPLNIKLQLQSLDFFFKVSNIVVDNRDHEEN